MRMLAVSAVVALVAVLGAFSVQAFTLQHGDLIVTRPLSSFPAAPPPTVIHVDPQTGVQTVISLINDPRAVTIDANGHLIVVDWGLPCDITPCLPSDIEIVRIDPVTGTQSVIVAFPYEYGQTPLYPSDIAIDASGNLFMTASVSRILRIDSATGDVTVVTMYPTIFGPTSIAIDANGDLIVVHNDSLSVVRIDPVTGTKSEILEFEGGHISGIAIDPYGDLLLTVIAPRKKLCFGGSNDGNPCSNHFDCRPGGSCRIVLETESYILRVDPETGDQTVVSSEGPSFLSDIAVDANGDIFVLEYVTLSILRIDPETGARETVSQSGFPPYNTIAIVPNTKIEIELDIHPGSDANRINPSSRGVIPVAILGSDDFDVDDVDVTTLVCGPDGAAPEHKQGGHAVDINQDGLTDLLSHYRTQETGIAPGDTQACVSGLTLDGIPFQGCDEITTVPARGIRAD